MGERGVSIITPRSTVGFRGTRRRLKSVCAGSDVGRNQRVGGSMSHTLKFRRMGLSVPGPRQAWKHDRLLSLAETERKAAKRFLGKALNGLKDWERPEVINTDKAPPYGCRDFRTEGRGKCPETTVHRQVKYLNNVVEADHWQAETADPPSGVLQDAEDCL
jgi:DDE domain